MSEPEDVAVTTIDEVSDIAHAHTELRKLSDYKPTNTPLSEFEIEDAEAKDTAREGWAPRTTGNIHDMTPLPERPPIPNHVLATTTTGEPRP